ncbi:hypothetical protein CAXC1_160004 [Candidatus Xenohaliotis californiensis]|uniref:Uncharacterized protein n=1 Tax=Candidatus Xenohaliotis californiensis TaxID=84677 RepID=A0ABM9N858_9RICK|nr:hypothetical protein CAXC1_160004 [Candidatus Xenohaliotis californiensis]
MKANISTLIANAYSKIAKVYLQSIIYISYAVINITIIISNISVFRDYPPPPYVIF